MTNSQTRMESPTKSCNAVKTDCHTHKYWSPIKLPYMPTSQQEADMQQMSIKKKKKKKGGKKKTKHTQKP